MISVWRAKDDSDYKMLVSVPEFKISFSSITLPILAGYNDDSEESVIDLWYIYTKFVKFIDELLHDRFSTTCSQLSFEQVQELNKLSRIFMDYTKGLGTKKFLPDVEEKGYFPLRPTECIPYCQYVYEAVEDRLFDIKEFLGEHGLQEESYDSEIPFEIWE